MAKVMRAGESNATVADALIAKHADLITPVGPQCSVTTSKHRELLEALCTKGIPFTAVSRIARAEGFPVSPESLRRHHRGECQCRK